MTYTLNPCILTITPGGRGGCGCGDRDHGCVDSEDGSEEESESEERSESEDVECEGESESEEEIESVQKFRVGDRVRCHWYQDGSDNQWYDCVVLHLDNENHTAHVRCLLDNDEEENMSWEWMVLL